MNSDVSSITEGANPTKEEQRRLGVLACLFSKAERETLLNLRSIADDQDAKPADRTRAAKEFLVAIHRRTKGFALD